MTTKTKTNALSLMTVAAALAAQAQTAQPSATAKSETQPEISPTEQAIRDIKNPVPWLSWGADLRFRNEYYNDARMLNQDKPNHEQDYFRLRPRLWTSITPVKNLSLNARVTTEPRYYVEPSDSGAYNLGQNIKYSSKTDGYTGYDNTYGIIDTLNIQYKNIAGLPASLTVGRQDITLNEGWLLTDGTPLDGSWTSYVDAARFLYDFKEQQTTVEAIGLVQYANADKWLPVIDNQNRAVADQNEKGAVVNINNKSIKEANLGAYFIYKNDSRVTPNGALSVPIGAHGDDADIYTIGGRASGAFGDHVKYSAEGAYQFGRRKDPYLNNALLDSAAQGPGGATEYRDIDAFGVNSKVSYQFNDSMKNVVSLAYEFLSGDDKKTKNDEMFDVLWGRYPRWTDLYTYVYIKENQRICQYNNYHRFGPTWTFTPVNKLDVSLTYNALFAVDSTPTRAATTDVSGEPGATQPLFGGGNFRGHFVQSLLRYKFNEHVSALLQGEAFAPGDFYASNKLMSFVRAELNFTF